MKKRILFTLLLLATVTFSSVRCAPQVDVRPGAFVALEQMYQTGVQRADAEIAQYEQSLRDVDDRIAKLALIVPQTQKWVEGKKSVDYDVPCG